MLNEFQESGRNCLFCLSPFSRPMLENSTKENDKVKRRCVLIKPNEEMEEVLVCLSDKEAVKKLIGSEAEYKGEMENQNVAILGCVHSPPLTHRAKETKDLQKNDLGFELTPPCDTLYGTLLAFLVGENGMPIDLSVSHFRRSKKTLRKRQRAPEKVEEEEEEEIDYDHVDWKEWGCEGCMMRRSSKMLVMNEVLHIWRKEGHKVLVYTQTVSMLNIIEHYVKEQGFSYCRMDGSTPIVKRQALVDLFNTRGDVFLFLLTTRVGGLGINLIGADRVILFDPDWNPSVDIQARERCWRIGQKKPVTVYRLITSGTIEEKIYHRQIFKTVLSNRVLGEGNDLCSFTSTNLNDLFSYCGGVWGV